ncbi:hypothetical protein MTR_7g022950 [Medicago truncatula]|uniref:Uncharacterized protein n=1 Tax=Medicago truncatula TaxID=3880 RepID=G7KVP3_MEDTR|nr:hypothetical protein MTR_7g022950 [Medicago truncatula]
MEALSTLTFLCLITDKALKEVVKEKTATVMRTKLESLYMTKFFDSYTTLFIYDGGVKDHFNTIEKIQQNH